LRVRCTYHLRNKHGDSRDLYCYLHGWYDEKSIDSAHIFVGFDPCLVAKEDYIFNKYSDVSVEFQLEDKNRNLLALDLCQVVECGVRLLHAKNFTMETYTRCCPQDEDGLKAMFQAKRERFQADTRGDYYVMHKTYDTTRKPEKSNGITDGHNSVSKSVGIYRRNHSVGNAVGIYRRNISVGIYRRFHRRNIHFVWKYATAW